MRIQSIIPFIFLVVAACTASTSSILETGFVSAYPDLGPAPEIVGDVWLNTDDPLRIGDLHGNVILIDMWTYG